MKVNNGITLQAGIIFKVGKLPAGKPPVVSPGNDLLDFSDFELEDLEKELEE